MFSRSRSERFLYSRKTLGDKTGISVIPPNTILKTSQDFLRNIADEIRMLKCKPISNF